MKTYRFLLSFLVVTFMLVSCSKEKSIERHLDRKGGKWNILSEKSEHFTNDQLVASVTVANAGTIVFDENGNVIYTQVHDGFTEMYGGTWSNTAEEIRLIIDSEVLIYVIKDESRKKMTIEHTDSYTDFEGNKEVFVQTLELEKE